MLALSSDCSACKWYIPHGVNTTTHLRQQDDKPVRKGLFRHDLIQTFHVFVTVLSKIYTFFIILT